MKTILAYSGNSKFFLARETSGWVGFTQRLSASPISVDTIQQGLDMCEPDEIGGLRFELGEIPDVQTLRELEK